MADKKKKWAPPKGSAMIYVYCRDEEKATITKLAKAAGKPVNRLLVDSVLGEPAPKPKAEKKSKAPKAAKPKRTRKAKGNGDSKTATAPVAEGSATETTG